MASVVGAVAVVAEMTVVAAAPAVTALKHAKHVNPESRANPVNRVRAEVAVAMVAALKPLLRPHRASSAMTPAVARAPSAPQRRAPKNTRPVLSTPFPPAKHQ